MDRRTFLKTGTGIASLGLLGGCVGGDGGGTPTPTETQEQQDTATPTPTPTPTRTPKEPIKIGAIQPLSGNFTPWGKAHKAGLSFAVQEINANGGVNGRELQVITEDTQSDPSKAATILQRFVEQDGISVATGPVSSDVGIRTSRTANQLQVPLIVHMAGSAKVIEPQTNFTYRGGLLPAPTTVKAQAQIAKQKGYSKIGAIVASYAWGESVKKALKSEFPVDVQIQTASLGTSDFRPFIRKLPQDIEMMISTGHPPGTIAISKQMAQIGYQPEITTGPSIPPGVLYGALGETALKVNQTHIHLSDVYASQFKDVASRFESQRDGRFATHEGYGYMTGKLVAEAVRQAGSAEPTRINSTLKDISFDTIYPQPLKYADSGEMKGQQQLYSQFETSGDSWQLTEFFRTDPLPALPAKA